MATSLIQVRVEDELKESASHVFESLGIDTSTAIRMFLRRAVIDNGIPFSVILPHKAIAKDELSTVEFDKMMYVGLKEAIEDDSSELDDVFDELKETKF